MKKIVKYSCVLALLSTTVAVADGMTASEWAKYKKDCYDSGGSPGVHEDGSPGCCHVRFSGDSGDIKKVTSYKEYKDSIKSKRVESSAKIKADVSIAPKKVQRQKI